jgi:acetolactate synthase I/II/III large subunit
MKVAEAVVECLKREAVEVVYGYPGAAVIAIYDELRKANFNHILVRHEQAAAHCASGYARASGKPGVCIVTSGPGATNIITGIATAYMDSIPMVIITGQVNTSLIGKDAFQEADITGSTNSFIKHNYLVKDEKDIPRVFKEAFYIAKTGRPGPVLIDIPMDLQEKSLNFEYPTEVNIRGYKPKAVGHKLQIKRILERIAVSKKPIICVGGGVPLANAIPEFREFVHKSNIPVVHSLMGKDCLPSEDPSYIGLIGMHGFSMANRALSNSDTVILIGTRLGDRSIAGQDLLDNTEIIHIDIDPAEIGKNFNALLPVVGDAKDILKQLNEDIEPIDTIEWTKEIRSFAKKAASKAAVNSKFVNAKESIRLLSEKLEDDAVIITDVGQNQIWTARNFQIRGNMRFLTVGGLGTMGYALPAAIGAKIGVPDRRVVMFVGDGGFQMSLPELGTLKQTGVNIMIVLLNNSNLGMVRELQNKMYKKIYGVELDGNPDFVQLAKAYGINSRRVDKQVDVEAAFDDAIASKNSFFLELVVDPEEGTLL